MLQEYKLPSSDDDNRRSEAAGYYVMLSAGEYVDGEERQLAARVRSHRAPALHALIVEAILEPSGLPPDMSVRQLLDQLDAVSTVDGA